MTVAGDIVALLAQAEDGEANIGEVRSLCTGELLASGPARALSPKTNGATTEVTLTEAGQQRLTLVPADEARDYQYLSSADGGVMVHQVDDALQLCSDTTPTSCALLGNSEGFDDSSENIDNISVTPGTNIVYVAGKPHILAWVSTVASDYLLFPTDPNQPGHAVPYPERTNRRILRGEPNTHALVWTKDADTQSIIDLGTGATTTIDSTQGWHLRDGAVNGWFLLTNNKGLRTYAAKS